MGTGRLLTVLGIIVLNFIGVIFLESKLQQYFRLELVIIVVGILLSIIALVGIAASARWAWPFATILFSLSLANVIFLHINVGAIGTFLVLLFVNVIGLLISILSVQDIEEAANIAPIEPMPLESYEEPSEVTYKSQSKKSKKKR